MVDGSKHFESLYPDDAREQEIRQLVEYVREGNSCQLIGIPGVGKAQVFGLLTYNKEIRLKHFPTTHEYIHIVNVDFSEARKKSLHDVVKLLFIALTNSLRERKKDEEYENVNKILQESLHIQDEVVLTQGLKKAIEYLAIVKKLTVIYLFGRFDEYIPYASAEFFTLLRLLRNLAKYRFSVVFALPRPLEDIMDPSLLSGFYEFIAGNHLFVRLYDPVSLNFRKDYIEKTTGRKLAEGVFAQILELTGGHSRLTRLSIETLLTDDPQQTTGNAKGTIIERPAVRNSLLEIWEALTPSEQEYLEKMTGEAQALFYLEKVGLVTGKKCTIPLLLEYVEDSSRIAATEKGVLRFDEATNTIKKGEMVVSDMLTKSEYRLLKHFLQNPDIIIERDDLIQVVWRENASTLGVTDQAVDQLVFRLRRKIEDDPNQPEHIQTIKGRGFKFSP